MFKSLRNLLVELLNFQLSFCKTCFRVKLKNLCFQQNKNRNNCTCLRHENLNIRELNNINSFLWKKSIIE